jgi:hypothetical protein
VYDERAGTGDGVSGWAGWVVFAAVTLVMVGLFHATMGFVALFNHGFYAVARSGLLVPVSYTTWGWIHIILGAVAVVTGFGLLVGQVWARVTGIVLALVSAVVNLGFFAAYPVWATFVIAFDVITIYALAVHGGELEDPFES